MTADLRRWLENLVSRAVTPGEATAWARSRVLGHNEFSDLHWDLLVALGAAGQANHTHESAEELLVRFLTEPPGPPRPRTVVDIDHILTPVRSLVWSEKEAEAYARRITHMFEWAPGMDDNWIDLACGPAFDAAIYVKRPIVIARVDFRVHGHPGLALIPVESALEPRFTASPGLLEETFQRQLPGFPDHAFTANDLMFLGH
ncbi:hypothetical protein V5P93_006294 [Actinokineospora auranticolor]|uniref:Uncharacterized protein n=1 Tax=Actinokineospora auranticolor TaxID=155976 RepID=A0A2S6GI31_9PSEU|nr:hypothetical protein [Actinokineospora auranticolor]PPK64892.1 hypothetical protein CLV40_117131 [Actinokineospora auranticolor]